MFGALQLGLGLTSRHGGGLPWYPNRLFQSGDILLWYDPSDLTTMFKDTAGTQPVTADGDSVALMLDKGQWGGKTLEQVRAAALEKLSSGTIQTLLSPGSTATFNTSTGVGTVYRDASGYSGINFAVAGYVAVDITSDSTALALRNAQQSGTVLKTVSVGRNTYIVGPVTSLSLSMIANSSANITVHSVKVIPGYHREQATGTSMPKYKTGPNPAAAENSPELLANPTFEAGIANWSAAGTINSASSGTLRAVGGGAVGSGSYSDAFPVTNGASYRCRVRIKGDSTYSTLQLGFRRTGSLGSFISTSTSLSVQTSYNTFEYVFTANQTQSDACLFLRFSGTEAVNVEEFSVKEIPASAPYIHWLLYDGTDDSHATGTITWGTDEVAACAGVTKSSDAAAGAFLESSSTSASNNGTFALLSPSSAAANYFWRTKGTGTSDQTRTTYAAPTTNVLTSLGKIGDDTNRFRINVDEATVATDQGTGNFGSYVLYFGRRGGSSLPFNGREYQTVIRSRLLSAAELSSLETFVAGKTGIIL